VTAARVTLGAVIRSEWIKLRSVRSTLVVLALTVVFMAGFPLLLPARPDYNPIDQSLFGVHFAALTAGVLGVVVITGEYATGMISATFAAVPRRLPVLWAKAVVLASTVFLLTFVAGLLAFEAGKARYGGATLGSPGALRAVAGAALFLTLTGLLGLGFGFLTRNTAGGVTAAVAFTFLVPQIGDLLPASWQPHVVPYLPFQAGEALYTVQPFPAYANELLRPWAAGGVLCGYAAVTITAAAVLLRRRDATASYRWRERLRERQRSALGRRAGTSTTGTATRGAGAGPLALTPVAVCPVTQAAVIRSEWIKFRSVRSSPAIVILTAALIVATSMIVAADTHWEAMTAAQRAAFDPIGQSLLAVHNFADFPVGVLGVLVITGEYATGMIRATLAAVPRRLPVLWGKAVVLAPAVFTVALVATLGAFLGGQAIFGSHGVSFAAPDAARAVIGAALFLTVTGLFGLGLGCLARGTAAGIAALVGIDLVLRQLAQVLPQNWQHRIVPYLPGDAGRAVFATPGFSGDTLSPWAGFALYCGYTAVILAAAALALRRRDA
jgi:hypothetical protein